MEPWWFCCWFRPIQSDCDCSTTHVSQHTTNDRTWVTGGVFVFLIVILVCCGSTDANESCWCGWKVDLGRSLQETGPVTPASRRWLAQVWGGWYHVWCPVGWRSSASSHCLPAQQMLPPPQCLSPHPWEDVLMEASFFSWRNAPVLQQKSRWVCCGEISDQRDGSGRNVIRPAVVKLSSDAAHPALCHRC